MDAIPISEMFRAPQKVAGTIVNHLKDSQGKDLPHVEGKCPCCGRAIASGNTQTPTLHPCPCGVTVHLHPGS